MERENVEKLYSDCPTQPPTNFLTDKKKFVRLTRRRFLSGSRQIHTARRLGRAGMIIDAQRSSTFWQPRHTDALFSYLIMHE